MVRNESESDNSKSSRTDLWSGESWFGSVKACASVGRAGHHCCFLVKTEHGCSPKRFLEEKMKDMPQGTRIVLEGRAKKESVDLVTLGYKYNKKKFLPLFTQRELDLQLQGSHMRLHSQISMEMFASDMLVIPKLFPHILNSPTRQVCTINQGNMI